VSRGALLFASFGLFAGACRQPPTQAAVASSLPSRARVIIASSSGRSSEVVAEVARTPEELERGLMFRERLAPGTGMLFVFSESAEHAFWMKNTLVPLDMIFVDEGGTVVGVVERAEPLSTALRGVGKPSRQVLEVPGGWAAEHGVRPGDRVKVE